MNIAVQATPARLSASAAWSRQTGANDLLARVLIVLVALAPIPLGSHRPFFWGLNAAIVGLAGVAYFLWLGRLGERPRRSLGDIWPSVILFAGVTLWLVSQIVPIDWLGPFADAVRPYLTVTTLRGVPIALQTISLTPDATALMLVRWLTYAVFFYLVLQVTGNQRRRDFMLHALLAIIAFYAAFGLASLVQFGDTLLGMEKWTYHGSATATFVNRNSFATFLAFGVVLAVALICGNVVVGSDDERGARWRFDPVVLVYLLGLAVVAAALLATQSRMGTFAALVGASVVAIAAVLRVPGLWVRALLILPLALVLLAVAFYAFGQNLIERLGSVESAADVRLDLYRQVIDMIAARPLLGYGGGSFELAYPLFHALPVSPDLVWDRAHNSYLALFAELGVIGGGAVLLALALAFLRTVSRMGSAKSEWAGRAAALGALVVGAVHSLTDFSLEIQANTLLFLMLVGMGALASRKARTIDA